MSESHEEWKKRTQYPDWENEKREMDSAWDLKMARLSAQNTLPALLAKIKKAREEKQNATTSHEGEADGVEESGQPS